MKKDTKFMLGLIGFAIVMHKWIIPRLPTPPGVQDRIPGSTTAMSREQAEALKKQVATIMPVNTPTPYKTQI